MIITRDDKRVYVLDRTEKDLWWFLCPIFLSDSRQYFTFLTMNEIISTNERIFISLVGPSGSGETHLNHEWSIIGTFQPNFDKIFQFYQH